MKTLEQIFDILEKNDISIDNYTENDILCGYELNSYTNAGVNEILFLDFRDKDQDPKNPQHFVAEFENYINSYSIDDRIENNRQSQNYCDNFTIKESLEDFTEFDERLRNILSELEGEDKVQTPKLNQHVFAVTDEDGRTAGIIYASTNNEFESALMDCSREHHCYDDAELQNSLLINDFIGTDKTVTVKLINDGDEECYYDMRIESVVAYGNKPSQEKTLYQVQNSGGNPAGTDETNPDAIFLTKENAEAFIEYLVLEANFDKEELKIVKL